ncbi:hypothetical protein [Rhodohalobacter barkolensis]|uniref:CDP-glycerol--glycerophosphate glycerophosphotransferase n=1 Tax=Rhodohalobacter barkolensis TaxID=2053187 RepID=A0A2N0VGG9_9BACT|nr:hypothetical protein [Rhodohalobacter barkolensis]PKD43269.1 hypothetical protein CWD77_11685 [Rhodohalobacter barkolensis]
MINWLVKKITGKQIVFVHRHRNTIPIIEDNQNRYIFFDPGFIWKSMGIVGKQNKLRYRLMYLFLSLVKPVWIISFNWLDKLESLYLVWANDHQRQFIVVQHGIYYGGIMRDIQEKYIKCNIMLVWSDYFRKMFLKNNPKKEFRCISFGNPVYNQYNRKCIEYSENPGDRILLVPSLTKGHRLEILNKLIENLLHLDFEVTIKEHYLQSRETKPILTEGCIKTEGDDFHLYRLVRSQKYDVVITDVSTAMTDSIFFKNRVIYFSPEFDGIDYNDNVYEEYLPNIAHSFDQLRSRSELFSHIDLEAQEQLLKRLVKTEHLSNDLAQLTENRDIKDYKLNNLEID